MNNEQARQVLHGAVVNHKFTDMMATAYSRYEDEGKYEKWTDYDKFLRDAWNTNVGEGTVLKTTKRPFGLVIDFGEVKWKVVVKRGSGRKYWVEARRAV